MGLAGDISSRTGAAYADRGGLAVSGNLHLHGPLLRPARSSYVEQVRQGFERLELVGREAELAALSRFCLAEGDGGYWWWQAPAWSGKSALMASFVLAPPPGVQIVSFFVTARYRGHDNREAFLDIVVEQLAELLGEPMPQPMDVARPACFFDLLKRAAMVCREARERLVLVIDGLDEDQGVTNGPDAYSIAGLLPAVPEHGLRVVISGRPRPPVPDDVPEHHPLRNPDVVRRLKASAQAQVLRGDMRRELGRLLRGGRTERDLLGLLVAARGGLSASDLAELTDGTEWEITNHLSAVAGRSFEIRQGRWRPTDVFLLGHEELQREAEQAFGPADLGSYRQRLHKWACNYRNAGWPMGTPEYLLRGYFRLLQSTGDVSRMVQCGTDRARHDRMLGISGGDAAALAEINSAQKLMATAEEPDLTAMCLLSIQYDLLNARNSQVSPKLPAVWVALGKTYHAESLAASIPNPADRLQALISVTEALVASGDWERAGRIATQAEDAARAITDSQQRPLALAKVASVQVKAGMGDRARQMAINAEQAASMFARSEDRVEVLKKVAEVLGELGDRERSGEVISQVEYLSNRSTKDRDQVVVQVSEKLKGMSGQERVQEIESDVDAILQASGGGARSAFALAQYSVIIAEAGELMLAGRVACQSESVVRAIVEVGEREEVMYSVVSALVKTRQYGRAEALARDIANLTLRGFALYSVVQELAKAGQFERAELIVPEIVDHNPKVWALSVLVEELVRAGRCGHAEAVARASGGSGQYSTVVIAAVEGLARVGQYDQASSLVGLIESLEDRSHALTFIAESMVEDGEVGGALRVAERAEEVAREVAGGNQQASLLAAIAAALMKAGWREHANQVASRAGRCASAVTNGEERALALISVADALIAISVDDRLCEVISQAESDCLAIADPLRRARVLIALTAMLVRADQFDRAIQVARQIEEIAFASPDSLGQVVSLAFTALMQTNQFDRAEVLAGAVAEPERQTFLLSNLAVKLAAAGHYDRAEEIALTAASDDRAWRLSLVAMELVKAGQFERAERLACAITDNRDAVHVAVFAQSLAKVGEGERAIRFARQAENYARLSANPPQEASVRTVLVEALARGNQFDCAESVVGSIADREQQALAGALLSEVLAERRYWDRAEATSRGITVPNLRARAEAAIVEAMAKAGCYDRAENLAHAITEVDHQARAFVVLAQEIGWSDRSRKMLARSIYLAGWKTALDALAALHPAALVNIAAPLALQSD
jgi:tetratricopeptide (TPR) repeat protein